MIQYLRNLASVNTKGNNFLLILCILISGSAGRADLEQDLPSAAEIIEEAKPDPVHECGMRLLQEVGKTGPETEKLPGLYSRASSVHNEEFLMYMMAIIYVESGFNKQAKSTADAHGLMQMTEVAVKDAVRHCNLRPISMKNMFDSYTNVRYGTCYLNKLLQEVNGDWDRALIAYNGGYMQLQRYEKGENIASETANYVLKVKRALKKCID